VKIIDNNAFINCNSLEEVNIPDSVEFIGIEVFSGCNIQRLHISDMQLSRFRKKFMKYLYMKEHDLIIQ